MSDDLDELLLHLAAAIGPHARELQRNGQRVPPLLLPLARLARDYVTSRQDATEVAGSVLTLDVAGVEKMLLTKPEVSKILGVSQRTVERLVVAGDLTMVKVEGAARFRRADVDAYVAGLSGSFRDHVVRKASA